jgi:HD-like signal output (HDOD) protein
MTITPPPDAKKLAEQAVSKLTTLATLPEVTAQIIATVEDPRSSAAQLHKIVANDPVLVTRILKVVNSAFYGLPGQVASVERAIVLLGLNAVKNIAVAASMGQMFRAVKRPRTCGRTASASRACRGRSSSWRSFPWRTKRSWRA